MEDAMALLGAREAPTAGCGLCKPQASEVAA
jgi:hypothetical protein